MCLGCKVLSVSTAQHEVAKVANPNTLRLWIEVSALSCIPLAYTAALRFRVQGLGFRVQVLRTGKVSMQLVRCIVRLLDRVCILDAVVEPGGMAYGPLS